ncbi:MAG: YihY/virulence factor BrkB family protein [Candidatus Aminicenantes bacterium]|nr:YihY/virulence factor BrkB family protein [Candidatus Aminicenantes bacterium]
MNVLHVVAKSVKRFNDDKCWSSAIVISYFVLLCLIPLIALFFYLSVKIMGTSEFAFRSLNIFTDEFFARLDPAFFKRLQALTGAVANLGLFGLLGSLVSGSFLFSSLISTLNGIFRTNYHRSFFYNRLMEYVIMFVMGLILVFSLVITSVWTGLQRAIQESALIKDYINPKAIAIINNFFIQYLLPFALTFLVFFVIYKFIPEVKVYTGVAALAAGIGAFLFEVFKRIFAFYVAHFSAVGIVLSQLLHGTLTSIIFFLLWITFCLVILLWGAELAAAMNEERLLRAQAQAEPAAAAGGANARRGS